MAAEERAGATRRATPPGLVAEGLRLALPDGRGGRRPVLDVPAFRLEPGAARVLAGPSGSGKTTLLHVLAGIRRPDAGRVLWGGADLAALPGGARDRWRLRHVGFLFQDFPLLPDLSPLANVLLPATFGHVRVPGAVRLRAEALLDRLGAPAGRGRVAGLSRGEQQRVALARALVLDPPVLVADEPTAHLDPAAAAAVADLLAGLVAGGRSLLLATHDPTLVARFGPVTTLAHGRIADGGPA